MKQTVQLEQYEEVFRKNHINGYALVNLTESELEVHFLISISRIEPFKSRVLRTSQNDIKEH